MINEQILKLTQEETNKPRMQRAKIESEFETPKILNTLFTNPEIKLIIHQIIS